MKDVTKSYVGSLKSRTTETGGSHVFELKPMVENFFSSLIITMIFGDDYSRETVKLNVWQKDGSY